MRVIGKKLPKKKHPNNKQIKTETYNTYISFKWPKHCSLKFHKIFCSTYQDLTPSDNVSDDGKTNDDCKCDKNTVNNSVLLIMDAVYSIITKQSSRTPNARDDEEHNQEIGDAAKGLEPPIIENWKINI